MKSGTVTAAQLAAVLGITKPRVAALATDGVLPRVSRGEFNLAQCVQAFVRHRVASATAADGNVANLTAERSRLARLKADQVERAARLEAGELIEASDITPAWLAVANTVRSRMLAIPTRLATRMVGLKTPAEAEALLRKEIHAGLTELADTPRV